MRHFFPCALLLVACRFDASTSTELSAIDADVLAPDADRFAPDADPNAPDSSLPADGSPNILCSDWGLQPALFDPCGGISVGGPNLILQSDGGEYVYNTSTGLLLDPSGNSSMPPMSTLGSGDTALRVLIAGYFEVGANASLRVEGDHPLLVVAWDDIVIDGTIDLSSDLGQRGAGSNYAGCFAAGHGTNNNNGGSGGGGGGFGGNGAAGGVGGNGAGNSAGGEAGLAADALEIRGGCEGGNGGNGSSTGLGLGGAGGGAIYLNARKQLLVNGTIQAGGQGGTKATGGRSAGGGGGSGGLIAFESDQVTLSATAVVAANGGGGGGGGNMNANKINSGLPGQASAEPALGGQGDNGSNGGNGGALGAAPIDGQDDDRGAGAGGGSVGVINVTSNIFDNQGATMSPPAQTATYSPPQ